MTDKLSGSVKIKQYGVLAGAMLAAAAFLASEAQAGTIAVVNPSFETPPASGLPFNDNEGPYSVDTGIPGWTTTGSDNGEWQPSGPPFNYLPDGPTVSYTGDGTISQTVGVLAQAGEIYVLQVDLGFRQDCCVSTLATIALDVGSHTIYATGTPSFGSGNWANYTATYTATAADAGKPISIVLASPVSQGDFDNVRLAAVPEPATWALMLIGIGGLGVSLRAGRKTATAAG
jgi:hypothetical protein